MSTEPTVPYDRPLPAITNLNRPFWEALRQHRLSLQRCGSCHQVWYPPGPWCPFCWSRSFTWDTLSGRATVSSFVVFHTAYFPAFAAEVPYNVAEVELAEGPRLLADVVDVAPDQLSVGTAVEVVFDDVTAELTLARFRPVPDRGA